MIRMKTETTVAKAGIRAANQEKIIRCAAAIFASKGYSGATVQEIAVDAGLPKANVLYYFKSKEGIYSAVLNEILSLWNSSFDRAGIDDDPAEIFSRYILEKMELSRTYPHASKIFAMEMIKGAPHLSEGAHQAMRDWFQSRVNLIRHWIRLGKMDSVDPEQLLFHIWSATQHYADFSTQINLLRGREMSAKDFDSAGRYLCKSILAGIGLVPKYRKVKANSYTGYK